MFSLIPSQWPVFDEVVVATFSPSSSVSSTSPPLITDTLPSTADLAAMPIPPSRASPRSKNPNHIPRPRNAFMLFRSAFAAAQKISTTIEHDNRHITRIIAHCWNSLSDADKEVWRDKAAAEKAQHAERYPDYRFRPVGRAKKPKKRKVRRNGIADVKRCETVAHLVMAGKSGVELERAMKKIEKTPDSPLLTDVDAFFGDDQSATLLTIDPLPHACDVPPFLSPLSPPVQTTPQQVVDESMISQPLVFATALHAEPDAFCSPAGTDTTTLFHPSCSQYYPPDLHNDVTSQTVMSPTQYQPVMTFAQTSHAEPDQGYSLFAWNQPDSFPYYR